ncbi:cytochrome c [Flavobacterium sp.]|uniref:c-type cytochrome n=1 Tax=Flavobacterium sp. TaxID=239 RepID=UPI00260D2790|nr:cytochrome c [Flavobacterium sp.]
MKNYTLKIILLLVTLVSIILLSKVICKNNSSENNLIKIEMDNKLFEKGKNLFIKNCVACHYIGMDKVATSPSLGGITKIRKKDWLYNYTRDSSKMFKKGDSIAKKIREKELGLMVSFPYLSNADLDAIYYFVEKNHELPEKKKIRKY